jgi:hypothetical protein
MSLISLLVDMKGGATLDNLQKLVNEELSKRKKLLFLKRVSSMISEILVGIQKDLTQKEIDEGKSVGILMTADQVSIYEKCMEVARECWTIKSLSSLLPFHFTEEQIEELKGMM